MKVEQKVEQITVTEMEMVPQPVTKNKIQITLDIEDAKKLAALLGSDITISRAVHKVLGWEAEAVKKFMASIFYKFPLHCRLEWHRSFPKAPQSQK